MTSKNYIHAFIVLLLTGAGISTTELTKIEK